MFLPVPHAVGVEPEDLFSAMLRLRQVAAVLPSGGRVSQLFCSAVPPAYLAQVFAATALTLRGSSLVECSARPGGLGLPTCGGASTPGRSGGVRGTGETLGGAALGAGSGSLSISCFFFFNNPAPTEISPLPLHAALPISDRVDVVDDQSAPLEPLERAVDDADVVREQARLQAVVGRIGALERLVDVRVGRERHDRGERDRKSTRLNSSHLVISYAVFCLKK